MRATILILLVIPAVAAGQMMRHGDDRPASDSLGRWMASFERLLSSYAWNGYLHANSSAGPWGLTLDLRSRSRLVRSSTSTRQDEIQDTLELRRPVTEGFSFVARQQSAFVLGPASVDLGELSEHRLQGGISGEVLDQLVIAGLAGWEWNRQQGQKSDGPSYTMSAFVPSAQWEDIVMTGRAGWSRSDLGNRQPHDAEARLTLLRAISDVAGDSVQVQYRSQRRDLITGATAPFIGGGDAGPGMFRRDERLVSVRNTLWSEPLMGLRTSLDGGFSTRTIDRSVRLRDMQTASAQTPTSIQQLQFDLTGRCMWLASDERSVDAVAGYSSAEERHEVPGGDAPVSVVDEQERQARRRNNQFQRTFATLRARSALTEDLDVAIGGSANLLRYDTPDTLNTDDRDEALFSGMVDVQIRLGPRLVAGVTLEGALDHLVYISRYQSANNLKLRTIRLAPTVTWEGSSGVRNTLRSEVAATYTVYDFEDQLGSVQSYSFRQVQWSDSLIAPIGRTLSLEFTGTLRLFERGLLRWREFLERPERSFREISWWPRCVVRRWKGITIALGFRSFRQDRYVHQPGTRTFEGSLGSDGPTASLDVTLPGGGVMMMSGWRETQKTNGRSTATISNMSIVISTVL